MRMAPSLRKAALCVHITCSVGFTGAVGVFLVLAIIGLTTRDLLTMRAIYPVLDLATWSVIVPLSFASLLSGIVQSLGTEWGLLRHYWVVIKLLLSLLATVVLLLQTGTIGYLAAAASAEAFSATDLVGPRASLVVHAAGGLLVLLTAQTMSVFKPRGVTPYGAAKRRRSASA